MKNKPRRLSWLCLKKEQDKPSLACLRKNVEGNNAKCLSKSGMKYATHFTTASDEETCKQNVLDLHNHGVRGTGRFESDFRKTGNKFTVRSAERCLLVYSHNNAPSVPQPFASAKRTRQVVKCAINK
eukprot:GEMP01110233.1.p1 GENE.GEMP01110233.1~~GEMP01110233.1.p1  ORF type:complete len:127 (+),score=8.76 GEMP01110233.1:317-697(+)